MKMIPSREFSARPGAVWSGLAEDGAVVVTRDGTPIGIVTPTSPETLLEDMQEIIFSKARHAVRTLREAASANGTAEMTMKQIDEEIRLARKSRKC